MACPSPRGSGGGNSSPIGHNSNNNKAPLLCSTNQRSRTACQRSTAPARCSPIETSAPASVPSKLSVQSSRDGTRCGRKFCNSSIASDSSAPPTAVRTNARAALDPLRTSAACSSAPKGR